MAKGNDGNYLQHCVEVEAAVRLAQTAPDSKLHVALTHGMEPFEQIGKPSGNAPCLLYGALCEAAGEPECSEREIVKAYRASWRLQAYRPSIASLFDELKTGKRYPNSAELLRVVIGSDRLSGGIAERDQAKHKELAAAWAGSEVVVARSSWRKQLGPGGALSCPDPLEAPWLFSMDPMTYTEDSDNDDANLHRSDLDRLAHALERYVGSGQPGVACLFVYNVGNNQQRLFWRFMDDLAWHLTVETYSFWVDHQRGKLNLAGLLFSDQELALGFVPPRIKPGRGKVR